MKYTENLLEIVNQINTTQDESIKTAAELCAETINNGKLVHLFGSGHSVLPIQDMFPRYGGVVGFHPIMDPRLMWMNVIGPGGARELLWLERQEGYIDNFLQNYNFQKGEVMIVYSHGGLNAAPIEVAIHAKKKGLKIVVVTSGDNYEKAEAVHSSGNKLADLADVVISNCCPLEDAIVDIPGYPQPVGGASTVAATIITQCIASETALKLKELGHEMFIFVSPNVTEVPSDYMNQVYSEYTEVVKRNGN